jgi:hypothetical protein
LWYTGHPGQAAQACHDEAAATGTWEGDSARIDIAVL